MIKSDQMETYEELLAKVREHQQKIALLFNKLQSFKCSNFTVRKDLDEINDIMLSQARLHPDLIITKRDILISWVTYNMILDELEG